MTRRRDAGITFGSDSFLDVIANIVGILIILIVIVGMKVAQQADEALAEPPDEAAPAVVAQSSDADTIARENLFREADDCRIQLAALESQLAVTQARHMAARREVDDLERTRKELLMSEQELSDEVRTHRSQRAAEAQAEVVAEFERASVRAESAAQTKELERLRESQQDTRNRILHTDLRLSEVRLRVEETAADEQRIAAETQMLREVLLKSETQKSEGPRLEHRLAPVSSAASEHEEHFRVSDGGIARIPIDDLIERLKTQVNNRSSAIRRFSRYEGTVGPVGGFIMSYIVERDGLNALQSMQYGGGGFRIVVSRWTVTPTAESVAESADAAIRPGSRYRQAVEALPAGSTVTFWVYPNSFDEFQSLREVAHGLQLKVAARPLPEGTPIIGSPAGSRSRAQ